MAKSSTRKFTVGEIIGAISVIDPARVIIDGHGYIFCRCDRCGHEHYVRTNHIKRYESGQYQGCGKCQQRGGSPKTKAVTLHGLTELQQQMISGRWSNP